MGLEILVKYAVGSIGIEWKMPYIGGAIVAVWLVLNESISILENLNDMKVPMPPFLMPFVRRLKSQIEDTAKANEAKQENIQIVDLDEEKEEDT